MSEDATSAGGSTVSFSTKEMLIRMDGKIDTVLSRQQNYDVEMALVKARVDGLELADHHHTRDAEKWQDEVRADVAGLRKKQDKLGRRHAYISGGLAALVVIAGVAVPLVEYGIR